MQQHNKFVWGAWLEEAVLDVTEANIDLGALLWNEPKTVCVDLQVAKSLFALEVGSDDQVI